MTGGNSGIGGATVAELLAKGAKVASLDVSAAPEGTSNDNRLDVKCNVGSEESVEAAVKAVVDKFNRIDILVNCAGVMDGFEPPGTCPTAQWEKVLGINLNGPFYTTRAVVPIMLKNDVQSPPDAPQNYTPRGEPCAPPPPSKGAIINICSVASLGGGSAGAAYTVSKHGLLGLTRSTAWMYRDEGIRCNAVLPGPTMTNIYQNSKVEFDREGLAKLQAFQGCMPQVVRSPDLVANAVVFLAGSENVTGTELKVDGGWTVC